MSIFFFFFGIEMSVHYWFHIQSTCQNQVKFDANLPASRKIFCMEGSSPNNSSPKTALILLFRSHLVIHSRWNLVAWTICFHLPLLHYWDMPFSCQFLVSPLNLANTFDLPQDFGEAGDPCPRYGWHGRYWEHRQNPVFENFGLINALSESTSWSLQWSGWLSGGFWSCRCIMIAHYNLSFVSCK